MSGLGTRPLGLVPVQGACFPMAASLTCRVATWTRRCALLVASAWAAAVQFCKYFYAGGYFSASPTAFCSSKGGCQPGYPAFLNAQLPWPNGSPGTTTKKLQEPPRPSKMAWLPCVHIADPPHSLRWLFCRPCAHIADPPHSLYWLFHRPCAHTADPPHSLYCSSVAIYEQDQPQLVISDPCALHSLLSKRLVQCCLGALQCPAGLLCSHSLSK